MTGPGGGPSKGLIELGAGGRTEGHNVGPGETRHLLTDAAAAPPQSLALVLSLSRSPSLSRSLSHSRSLSRSRSLLLSLSRSLLFSPSLVLSCSLVLYLILSLSLFSPPLALSLAANSVLLSFLPHRLPPAVA